MSLNSAATAVRMGAWAGAVASTQNLAVAAAGNDLATATGLVNGVNVITAATATSADGVRLPANAVVGDMVIVVDYDDAAVDVWPATAAGKINNGSAGAAVTLSSAKAVLFVSLGSENWARVGDLAA
jgi:hypothetical protein